MKRTCLLALVVIAFAVVSILTGCQKKLPSGVAETTPPPAAPSEQAPDTAAAEPTPPEPPAPPASSTNWIGKPLGDFLDTIDYPTSYEMKTRPGGQTWEMPGSKLPQLEDGRAKKFKICGVENWAIIDLEGSVRYDYRGKGNIITKTPLPDIELVLDPNVSAEREATILREEVVDGYDCWVSKPACIGAEYEVWVDKKQGLVRQARHGDGITRYNYYRINEVPDSEFELPDGMEIEERESFEDLGG